MIIYNQHNYQFNYQFMELKLFKKNVYGNDLLYPACDIAKKFAILLGVKTFTARAIENIKNLGYKVTVSSETYEL